MVVGLIIFLTFALLATVGLGLILNARVSRRAAWVGVVLSILFFLAFGWLVWAAMQYGMPPPS